MFTWASGQHTPLQSCRFFHLSTLIKTWELSLTLLFLFHVAFYVLQFMVKATACRCLFCLLSPYQKTRLQIELAGIFFLNGVFVGELSMCMCVMYGIQKLPSLVRLTNFNLKKNMIYKKFLYAHCTK